MSASSGRAWLTAATTRLELIALAALSLGAAAIRARIDELQALDLDLTKLYERAARLEPRDCDPSGICHVIPMMTRTGRSTLAR